MEVVVNIILFLFGIFMVVELLKRHSSITTSSKKVNPVNDNDEEMVLRKRHLALVFSLSAVIILGSEIAIYLGAYSYYLGQISGPIGYISLMIGFIYWRKSAIKDFELFNIKIYFPPSCRTCGSSLHSTIYCENKSRPQPIIDWKPTLKAISSEPLGPGGDEKLRFAYLAELSKKRIKKPKSDDSPQSKSVDEMNDSEVMKTIRLYGIKLNENEKEDMKAIRKTLKQHIKLNSDRITETHIGKVDASFPLKCSAPTNEKDSLNHLVSLMGEWNQMPLEDRGSFSEKYKNRIGKSCDENNCIGKIVWRD